MKATDFEWRHPTLIRHGLIAAAVATYLFDPDDVVWRLIKASPDRRALEHGFFFVGTILIGVGAVLCTTADAFYRRLETARNNQWIPGKDDSERIRRRSLGEFLYAVGFASLLPLAGFFLLVCGELVRIVRLVRRENAETRPGQTSDARPAEVQPNWKAAKWGVVIRQQAAKWGMFVSMIVFMITLKDRLVEILACSSGGVWAILNLPTLWRNRV
jgi:hypothetical protein